MKSHFFLFIFLFVAPSAMGQKANISFQTGIFTKDVLFNSLREEPSFEWGLGKEIQWNHCLHVAEKLYLEAGIAYRLQFNLGIDSWGFDPINHIVAWQIGAMSILSQNYKIGFQLQTNILLNTFVNDSRWSQAELYVLGRLYMKKRIINQNYLLLGMNFSLSELYSPRLNRNYWLTPTKMMAFHMGVVRNID